MKKFLFHSRHIPRQHLNMSTPVAAKVVNNLLCDALEPEYASQLADSGVSVVETRVVWWELEPEPGKFDWSSLDENIEKVEKAGLEVGIFPWFMHPPKWESELVRAVCLEHGIASTIPSLWDERFLAVYDRLYGALAERYGQRIKYLYFSIYGDFGEPQYPHDTKHYLFSSPDAHIGYWCGDHLARADFARYLKDKYGKIDHLNNAWGTAAKDWDDDLMPCLPISANSLRRRMDFRDWYVGSLMSFTDKVCRLIRRHFPTVYAGAPVGTLHEGLAAGQIKSEAVRIMSSYADLVRWTGLINEPDYGIMNLTAQRVASAVRFYSKAKFGTEAALELNDKVVDHVLYANISCGSHVLHNDLTNIQRGWDKYLSWRDKLEELPVTCNTVLYYPVEGEQLECMTVEQAHGNAKAVGIVANEAESVLENAMTRDLYSGASELRKLCNYEIADSLMIKRGYLDTMQHLFVVTECPIPEDTAKLIREWVNRGGKLWYNAKSVPWILETGERWDIFAPGIGEGVTQWPDIEPYAAIRKKHGSNGETVYSALHGAKYSVYVPEQGRIEIFDRDDI